VDVPLVDLAVQHAAIATEIHDGFERVFKNTSFILGEEVAGFEEAFAAFCEVKHCVGVANGTDALELCLRAARIGAGDAVLVPVNTFAATALAVVRAGARPVFVDVDPEFHLIDVADAEKRITPDCKAVIPVHLYGQVAPMEAVSDLAGSTSLAVVEDAAQAQGASRHGVKAGGFGLAAGTSFYPGKNLGAYGDAGAVLTNSDEIARSVRALRNYGAESKYQHLQLGFNSRLDALQAVVLNVKLKRLSAWNEARRTAADKYVSMLREVPNVRTPSVLEGDDHIWHLFVIRVPQRDRVIEMLSDEGIGAGVHYPVPLHLQPAFASLGYGAGDFPVAEQAAHEVLSLPIYPEITHAQQRRVVDALSRALTL
jgi:dTDP-4-amino-4,6-dideoxygalactose transaminase